MLPNSQAKCFIWKDVSIQELWLCCSIYNFNKHGLHVEPRHTLKLQDIFRLQGNIPFQPPLQAGSHGLDDDSPCFAMSVDLTLLIYKIWIIKHFWKGNFKQIFHLNFSKYGKICLLVPISDLRIFPIYLKWKFQWHRNNLGSVYHVECWKLWSKPGISMWLYQSWNVPAGSIISIAPQMLSTPFLLICHWRTNHFINYVCRTVNS